MKILLALNSFKGSCNSVQANEALLKGLIHVAPKNKYSVFPLFDGGDGSVSGLHYHKKYKKYFVVTENPIGNKIYTYYLYDKESGIAYVELAQASGIHHFPDLKHNDIKIANTYGTGLIIREAMRRRGLKKIVLLIGGSATNDAGLGILSALGYSFENKDGKFIPVLPKNFTNIFRIIHDTEFIKKIPIEIWTDVNNPFYGNTGAVAVYSEQKGATRRDKIVLEKGMKHLHSLFKKEYNVDVQKIPGTGAAGGIAGGLAAVLKSEIKPGTEMIFDILHVENELKNQDLIITGEGSLDSQSTYGKLVNGICDLAKKYNKPVLGVCGMNKLTEYEKEKLGMAAVLSIVPGPVDLRQALKHWETNLINTGKTIGAFLQLNRILPV